jgi:uncharacterized protein (TIGR00251 family)
LANDVLHIRPTPTGVLIPVKAVPGSSKQGLKGELGERLKVALTSPPEKGKANKELCALLAKNLGVPAKSVSIHSGHGSPRKVVEVKGVTAEDVRSALEQTQDRRT